MKKILVSQCLYGEKIVRYDAGEKALTDPLFLKWKKEGRLVPVCPEVAGGLPVPRPEAQRVGDRVMRKSGEDISAAYIKGAEMAVELAAENGIEVAIMKDGSPACGSSRIHDGSFSGRKIPGEGICVEYLRKAGIKVFNEKECEKVEKYLR
jgi:uncharacterized protein YbbK (DUF523 family)